ncbi:MAG: alpha/beta hydrolase [Oscillospiraceae bacterium]|nr:alpha/beta hydrolase [Oscillospiraceae bacterium]
MKYFEFGKENSELLVLLHGGGTSYLGMLPTAKIAAEKYHVILLAYDGFNPSEPDTEFRSISYEAGSLEDYILEHCGGKVDILYGLSYGCRTLMQILEDNRLEITTTIADGMPLRDYPDIRSPFLKEVYLFFFTGIFFVVMGRAGKWRKRFLAKITGRSIEEADRVLYTKASWKSWKNQDGCLIGEKTDHSVFQNTDMHIWYGIQGTVDKKLSQGIEDLKKSGYPFSYKIFPDMGHGGLAGENPERFLLELAAAHESSSRSGEKVCR